MKYLTFDRFMEMTIKDASTQTLGESLVRGDHMWDDDDMSSPINRKIAEAAKNGIAVSPFAGFVASLPIGSRIMHGYGRTAEEALNRVRSAPLRPKSESLATPPSPYYGPEVKQECAGCGKIEHKRHPGHFLCGAPECREKAIQGVKTNDVANKALLFITGLNLQDHPVTEQRQALEVVRALQTALKPNEMKREMALRGVPSYQVETQAKSRMDHERVAPTMAPCLGKK